MKLAGELNIPKSMSRQFLISVILLVPMSGVSAQTVTPACSDLGRWSPRGIASSFVSSGDDLYVADGLGLALYDVSNPRLPRLVDRFISNDVSLGLEPIAGGVALLTENTLERFTSSSARLTRTATRKLRYESHSIAAAEDLVVVAARDRLETYRSSGDGFEHLASIEPAGSIIDVAISGDRVFAATEKLGLVTYRATDLTQISSRPLSVHSLESTGDLLIGARKNLGFSIFRIDAGGLTSIGSGRPGHNVEVASMSGDLLVVSDGGTNTTIWSIADPANPVELREYDGGYDILEASGTILFASGRGEDQWGVSTGSDETLEVFDLSGAGFQRVSALGPAQRAITGVDVRGFLAFVSSPLRFSVVDFGESPVTTIASIDLEHSSPRVRLAGNTAILYGGRWVQLVDISDPTAPRLLGVWETLGEPGGSADMAGDYLVEANFASGFHVVDISDPSNPYQVGGLINGAKGVWRKVAGAPGVVYGLTSTGLVVVDIRQPSTPKYVNEIDVGSPTEIRVGSSGRQLAVLDNDELLLFDISDRYSPKLLNVIDTGAANDLDFGINSVWVLRRDGSVVKIGNPAIPSGYEIELDTTAPRVGLQIGADETGAMIAVADRYSLLGIADPSPDVGWGAVVPPAPLLLERNRNFALVENSVGRPVEVMVTSDAGSRTFLTSRPVIAVNESAAFTIRLRATAGCSAASWSSPLEVEASSNVFFVSSASELIVPAGSTRPLRLPIRNETDSTRTARISSSSSSILANVDVSLPAGSTTIVDLPISASEALGTIEAVVTLTWSDGVDEHRVTLTRVVAGPTQSPPDDPILILPGIGSTAGARDTRWQSDLHIFCNSETTCDVDIYYRPDDRTSAIRLPVGARATVRLEDVARRYFSADPSIGYILIDSQQEVQATGWTYNTSDIGRFGQQINPISPLTSGFLTGLETSERYRTNLGLLNPSDSPARVEIEVTQGLSSLGTKTIELDPWESTQFPVGSLVSIDGPFSGATLRFESSAAIGIYGSRVDQITGDPALLPAQNEADSSGPLAVLDPVGTTPGAEDSFWMTELSLTNATPRFNEITLDLIPTITSSTRSTTVRLSGGETLSTESLLSDYFEGLSADDAASATLRISGEEPFGVWGRVYNVGPNGTFGQILRPFGIEPGGAPMLRAGTIRSLFPVEQSDRRRTNLGMTETSGLPGVATVRLFDSGGTLLFETQVPVEGLASFRANGVLAASGLTGLIDARIEIEVSGDAALAPWISVVENDSGDARYIN